jgi:hypothetical protein
MQTASNAIWKAKPKGTTVSRLIRARAASLGLVAALGFLLMVSLVVSTVLTAFGNYLDSILPFGKVILTVLNVVVSLVLISFLFAAISPSEKRSLTGTSEAVQSLRVSEPRARSSSFSCGFTIQLKYFCLGRSSLKSMPTRTAASKPPRFRRTHLTVNLTTAPSSARSRRGAEPA